LLRAKLEQQRLRGSSYLLSFLPLAGTVAVLWGQSHFDGIVAAILLYGVALLLLRSTRLSAWNIDYNYWSFCRACRSPAWRRSGWAGGGPAWAEYQAAEVGECESGGQQYAHNPSGAGCASRDWAVDQEFAEHDQRQLRRGRGLRRRLRRRPQQPEADEGVLHFTPGEWHDFLADVKNGEFGIPIRSAFRFPLSTAKLDFHLTQRIRSISVH